jgi:uncharacterized integral membrane protein (TIGR00698 family)
VQPATSPARLVPGVVAATVAGALALVLGHAVSWVPAFALCVAAGAAVGTARVVPTTFAPGLSFSSGTLLRAGVVLLGFDLAFPDVLALGGRALAVVAGVVALTYIGTRWIARKLGVSEGLGTLVAVGFSICGVSAIAAARGVVEADEDEVTFAVALVTLCGTLAIVTLPPLRTPLGLSPEQYGAWVGASVHDVGQVVATSAVAGKTALATAAVVKLTRVLMLAPLIAVIAVRSSRGSSGGDRLRGVPAFVLLFVAAIGVASTGLVGSDALIWIDRVRTLLLAAALVALGTRVDLRRLTRIGLRPLVLGLTSWALIAIVAYVGVRLAWR